MSQIELRTGVKVIVGANVTVKYEGLNPSNAYVVENTGKISWD